MLQKEEGTLAVLFLDGHVKQGLSIGHSVIDRSPWAQQLSCYGVHTWQGQIAHVRNQITMQSCNKVTHSKDYFDNAESTVLQLPCGSVVVCTCPEGQAQHCLVHGVFETEVWNDLEVVGGMKCIGCKRAIKGEISGSISGCSRTLAITVSAVR